jgi:MFS family permease
MTISLPTFSPAQAIISAMITPALLVLACASLIATAHVRLARIVDRVRALAQMHDAAGPARSAELDRHERRARLVMLAVALFFAAAAVVVAAGISIALDRASGDRLTWLPLSLTLLGMLLIVTGAGTMLVETVYAAEQVNTEIAAIRGADAAVTA